MRGASTLLAPVLALTVATGTLPATLGVAEAKSSQLRSESSSPESSEPLKEAEALYKKGKVHFEIAEYQEALSLWKKAYALLPDDESARVVRHALVYNISEAEIKAYEVNRNPTHLRKAKVLLERYLNEHRAFYGDSQKATKERTDVRDRLAETERMIKESEARGEQSSPIESNPAEASPVDEAAPNEPGEPAPPDKTLSPRKQREFEIRNTPELKREYDKARKRIISGAVMLGIGTPITMIGLASLGAAGSEPSSDATIDLARGGLIGFGTVATLGGLGLLAGGGALLGLGIKKRKALLNPPKAAVLPYASPKQGGVVFHLRF